jgi:transposase
MRGEIENTRIFLKPGNTDLRKGAKGLTVMVQETLKLDPFSDAVYLFCNRERRLLKAVWWDRTGFWLIQKRLDKEKWPWPENGKEAREIQAEELKMLLRGIDFFSAHKTLSYKRVA